MFLWDRQKYQLLVQLFGDEGRNRLRDCGPICFYYGDDGKIGMLDFFYGYQRPCDDLLPSVLHWKFDIPNYISNLVWEGGNCLVDGIGGLVTSTSSYTHNTDTVGCLSVAFPHPYLGAGQGAG